MFDDVLSKSVRTVGIVILAVTAVTLSVSRAEAVPAFAEQTGQPCKSCHVGGFGPQLMPFGRAFKMSGYTIRTVDGTLPFSIMAVASYLHTNADASAPPAPHYGVNNNATIDQVSAFVAGGLNEHFGGFGQFTYDGVGRAFLWDNLDLRAVNDFTLDDGTDLLVGLSLNNNPTAQDPWNTLSAWGFPYTDSDLAPAPEAATVINGGLAQSAVGVSAYAWYATEFYAEAGFYWTPGRGFMRAMGADGGSVIKGSAPYLRVAYQKDYGEQNFQFGATAFLTSLYPDGDRTAATGDNFQDVELDGSYQYTGDGSNVYQSNLRYTHEHQSLDGSFGLGEAANARNSLDEVQADVSYYWHDEVGATVGYFNVSGSADNLLYAGNRTQRPDSEGLLFQVDGTPFGDLVSRLNLRVGIQYRLFTKLNGAAVNYDGAGRNAGDDNTFRIFGWVAF